MIMLVSFLRVYCVIRYVPSFCVSNVAWKYSLPFDRTGVDVAMVLPFDLTVNACLARSVQLFPDSEWILASVNFPFFQFIVISKLPRAFRPETEPSAHTSGKAGNRWMYPAWLCNNTQTIWKGGCAHSKFRKSPPPLCALFPNPTGLNRLAMIL